MSGRGHGGFGGVPQTKNTQLPGCGRGDGGARKQPPGRDSQPQQSSLQFGTIEPNPLHPSVGDIAIENNLNVLREWKSVRKKVQQVNREAVGRDAEDKRWKPPEIGTFKLNVDAAYRVEDSTFSIGMLQRTPSLSLSLSLKCIKANPNPQFIKKVFL
ncbi:hypothetical protein POM88_052086 [Heracleum sosnowskyi]|uniref:Uncharacterized protein n=1 Tax=Heracleum sosnowskyi TaxID=360622 RepID=A0AAD8GSD0_9APIA|nr:hypothetical protein POM88_052086 [Heracleum sosnowskyi]